MTAPKDLIYISLVLFSFYTYLSVQKSYSSLKSNKKSHIMAEVIIQLVLLVQIINCIHMKLPLLAFTLICILFEHIQQVIYCYRQHHMRQHFSTIVLECTIAWYAFISGAKSLTAVISFGILLHIVSFLRKKTVMEPVCVS